MPESSHLRSSELLSADASSLVMVDVQARLVPQIEGCDAVVNRCELLLRGAAIFEIPIVVSAQYPRGLGETVPAIVQSLPEDSRRVETVQKLKFSAAEATGWPAAGEREDGRHQVVIAGLETHICILQTALDLLSLGYRVYLAGDASGSRRVLDHAVALSRLRDSGVIVTTVESILFEWCERAGTDSFRQMRDLLKDHAQSANHE